ncbi:MAG: GNAT family N-acetyltransferase [Victivallaceae bacterium]|nr:GNAT family N-acetyltransferase [Victivallaceae bacterium]
MTRRDFEIRVMTAADYDAAYDLWTDTENMGLNSRDDARGGIEKYLRRNPSTSFVALVGGRLAGAIMAGHDGRRGFIYHTAVGREFRRSGIGSALVEAALRALEAEGIGKAALVVFESNRSGNDFWESSGFTARPDLTYRNRVLTGTEKK